MWSLDGLRGGHQLVLQLQVRYFLKSSVQTMAAL